MYLTFRTAKIPKKSEKSPMFEVRSKTSEKSKKSVAKKSKKSEKKLRSVSQRPATHLRSLYMNENSYFSEKYLVGYLSHGSAICMKFLFL